MLFIVFLIAGVSGTQYWCQSSPCTTEDGCKAFVILNNSLSLSSRCSLVCGSPHCLLSEWLKCYQQCMGIERRHNQDGNIIGIICIIFILIGLGRFCRCW